MSVSGSVRARDAAFAVGAGGGASGSAFIQACDQGDAEALLRALRVGLSMGIDATDAYGRTALFRAIEAGNPAVIKILLENGANPNQRAINGFSPLIAACVLEKPAVVRELLRGGADVRMRDNDGRGAIQYAQHSTEIRDLLLCRAARDGHLEAVRELLLLNASLNAVDWDGWTPLIACCARGHDRVLRELFTRADILRADQLRGGAPRAAPARPLSAASVALYGAGGDELELEARDGAGRTALHHAACQGFHEMLRLLAERGADCGAPDGGGATALLRAAEGGHLRAVRFLIDATEGSVEVCGHEGAPLLRALASCREALPFEKCSRQRVRAALLFSTVFREAAATNKFHSAKLHALADGCIDLASQLLDTYQEEFAKRLLSHAMEGRTILSLALGARAARFVGHPYVQQYVDDLWRGADPAAASAGKGKKGKGKTEEGPSWIHRLRGLAPRSKFWLEIACYLVFLLLLTLVLEGAWPGPPLPEALLYTYIFGFAVDEARRLARLGPRLYFARFWSLLSLALIALCGGAGIMRLAGLFLARLRHLLTLAAHTALACAAAPAWLKLLPLLTFSRRLGEMLRVVQAICVDLATVGAIIALAIVGFGQALHTLQTAGLAAPDGPLFLPTLVDLFRAMLGDFDWEGAGGASPFLARAYLAAYLVLVNVLLLNLLIATFANSLTSVALHSRDELLFKLTERVLEYTESTPLRLPPPLNLLDSVLAGLARCCGRSEEREATRHQRLEGAAGGKWAGGAGGAPGDEDPDLEWIDAPFRKLAALHRAEGTEAELVASVRQAVISSMQQYMEQRAREMRAAQHSESTALLQRVGVLETALAGAVGGLDSRLAALADTLQAREGPGSRRRLKP